MLVRWQLALEASTEIGGEGHRGPGSRHRQLINYNTLLYSGSRVLPRILGVPLRISYLRVPQYIFRFRI